jgi:L-aspartate oxidase
LGEAAKASTGQTFGDEQFPLLERERLQQLAWEGCGITRNAAGMERVLKAIDNGGRHHIPAPGRSDYERRNLATVLRLVAKAALKREESRGGHYRTDFPAKLAEPLHSSLVRGKSTELISWPVSRPASA